MRYAVAILIGLALISMFPKMAALTHAEIEGFSIGAALHHSVASLFHMVFSTSQPVWLVGVGVLLIVLSGLVGRRVSRSASQSRR